MSDPRNKSVGVGASDTTRKAFEAWYRRHFALPKADLRLNVEGDYRHAEVETAWQAWQVASPAALPGGELERRLREQAQGLFAFANQAGVADGMGVTMRLSPKETHDVAKLLSEAADTIKRLRQEQGGLVAALARADASIVRLRQERAGPQPEPVAWGSLCEGATYRWDDSAKVFRRESGIGPDAVWHPQSDAGDTPAGWRPIESAPKDGAMFLMQFNGRRPYVTGVVYRPEYSCFVQASDYSPVEIKTATGWMLAAAPQPDGARQDNDLTVGQGTAQTQCAPPRSSRSEVPSTTKFVPVATVGELLGERAMPLIARGYSMDSPLYLAPLEGETMQHFANGVEDEIP
jgi:hypothetical protein